MSRRTKQALSILLPIGVLGASSILATAQATTVPTSRADEPAAPDASAGDVAARLQAIRESAGPGATAAIVVDAEEQMLLAQWVNVGGGAGWRNGGIGWRNGAWPNGGWRNAGWPNGGWRNGPWRNGPWRNGGWNNWGNGGWHNFWNNW